MKLTPGYKEQEGGNFTPVPAGVHVAICIGVVDLGTHYSEMYKKAARKVALIFQLPGELIEIEGSKESRQLTKIYTLSLHEKAQLRKDLEGWRTKKFTVPELKEFDLGSVIGRSCQLAVTHTEKDEKTYANITSIIPLPKGTPKPTTETTPITFSFQEKDRNLAGIPEFLQKKITASQEWQAEKGKSDDSVDEPTDAGQADDAEEELGF